MLFNSLEYIYLLTASLVAYWLAPAVRLRQLVVLAASAYFYMSWSYAFGLMLFAIILVNWAIGWAIGRTKNRAWLIAACVLNLGLLAYFKYMNFFLDNWEAIMKLTSPGYSITTLSIILPLGISFYVFELISYQVDLHKGVIRHERNPIAFSIFVLFFPHLIAGPICRAGQFLPQIHVLQRIDASKLYNGAYMFIGGLALKSGIADGIAPFVDAIFKTPMSYSGFDNLMATVGFGVQIFCDFWGYSLMALGAALLFGYSLPYNFNQPYSALSIRDFWRRWHITLSNWLRDYLYIALGGSRHSAGWKVQRNLVITMLLGGLWHGASWNFVIWGGIHGVALALNRWFGASRLPPGVKSVFTWKPMAWLLTMATVFVAWVFFRAPELDIAVAILANAFSPAYWSGTQLAPVFFELLLLFLPLHWLIHRTTYDNFDMTALPPLRAASAFSLLCAFSYVYFVTGNDFIYFQF